MRNKFQQIREKYDSKWKTYQIRVKLTTVGSYVKIPATEYDTALSQADNEGDRGVFVFQLICDRYRPANEHVEAVVAGVASGVAPVALDRKGFPENACPSCQVSQATWDHEHLCQMCESTPGKRVAFKCSSEGCACLPVILCGQTRSGYPLRVDPEVPGILPDDLAAKGLDRDTWRHFMGEKLGQAQLKEDGFDRPRCIISFLSFFLFFFVLFDGPNGILSKNAYANG